MTEPGDMLIVSAVRGELPPPPDGWQSTQHRVRVYDAPPRLSRTWTYRVPSIDYPDRYTWDIDLTPWVSAAEQALLAFKPFVDNLLAFIRQYGTAPTPSTTREYKAAAFAERHARHVERRRSRIVGMLRRSAQPIE